MRIDLVPRDQDLTFEDHLRRHYLECQREPYASVPQSWYSVLNSYDVESWDEQTNRTSWQRVWGLFDDPTIVGHVVLTGYPTPALAHRCALSIGIEREYRGQGWGPRLMRTAIDFAKESGLKWIDSAALAHNAPALALHYEVGFYEVGTLEDVARTPEGKSLDQVTLTLDLR